MELLPMKGAPSWQVVQDVCRLYKFYKAQLFFAASFLRLSVFSTFYDLFLSQPPGVPRLGLLLVAPILKLCASFRAHSSTDNVQAAKKFITGLDATRLSKFLEYRDAVIPRMAYTCL
ncbi:hypothetical protein NC651_036750 [Populus alba x Populus x berolinensis]|nr:hypothetical protein NC651_036750 [Populus alba x Populus x berolinensis]